MRILFAVDEHSYSANALPLVARLGKNTLADITLLLTQIKGTLASSESADMKGKKVPGGNTVLANYHLQLLEHFDPATSPYIEADPDDKKAIHIQKEITTCLRKGNPAREILEQAKKDECDLIIIGCSSQKQCSWKDGGKVPLWVANEAECSVLVIKEDKAINKVLCCLDHDSISQDSLEMVSQMVTLLNADLDIVVLTESEDVQEKIDKKLAWLVSYYTARDIFPFIELVKLASLENFISQQARWGLMAMWMGKKSILERVFPSNKVSRLLKANESSLLLLR